MIPSTAEIRQFLMEAFSDEELNAFCFDYFPDVYNDFAAGQSKRQKIQLLTEYCRRHDAMQNLIAALQRARPAQTAAWSTPALVPPVSVKRERDPKRIFISHAHQDREFAHRLAEDLMTKGWKVWIAPESIQPGEKWAEAIERGLDESGVFVVVMTPDAVNSRWVRTETSTAIDLEHQGLMQLIPVELISCDIPTLWRRYQRIDFMANYDHGLIQLRKALDLKEEIGIQSIPELQLITLDALPVVLQPVDPFPLIVVDLYQTQDFQLWSVLEGPPSKTTCVALSPDGTVVAAGFADGQIWLWHVKDGLLLKKFVRQTFLRWTVMNLAFTPDGKELFECASDSEIRRWALSTGEIIDSEKRGGMTTIAVSPNGSAVASGANDGEVCLWAVPFPGDSSYIVTLNGHSNAITSMAFAPRGNWLASASKDATVRVWEYQEPSPPVNNTQMPYIIPYIQPSPSATCRQMFSSQSGEVHAVAFSPDGEELGGGSKRSIWRWQIRTGNVLGQIETKGIVKSIAYSPLGDLVAAGCSDKKVTVWQTSDWKSRQELVEHEPSANGVAFSRDGMLLACCSAGNTVRLWKRGKAG